MAGMVWNPWFAPAPVEVCVPLFVEPLLPESPGKGTPWLVCLASATLAGVWELWMPLRRSVTPSAGALFRGRAGPRVGSTGRRVTDTLAGVLENEFGLKVVGNWFPPLGG